MSTSKWKGTVKIIIKIATKSSLSVYHISVEVGENNVTLAEEKESVVISAHLLFSGLW